MKLVNSRSPVLSPAPSIDSLTLPEDHAGHTLGKPTKVRKILFLLDSLQIGGTENQAVEVAARFDRSRYHVVLACLCAKGPLLKKLQGTSIRVLEFCPRGGIDSATGVYQLLRLALFLRRERFDVFHAHDLWSNLMGVPAAWLARTPAIISSRRDLAHLAWYTPKRRKIIRLIHSLSSKVLANSEAVFRDLVSIDKVDPNCIRVMRNAVDFDRFANCSANRKESFPKLDREHKLVAVVANMNGPTKGHYYLIEAARIICPVVRAARFVLIGDGPESSRLLHQVKQLGLEENFLFLGRREDVPELLSCCDLFVLPSTAEGLPNAILEAMAAGLPVVSTGVGGSAEIVTHGVNGLLVPPRDPNSLAVAILRLLQDSELARRLARAGKQQVHDQFTFNRLVRELEGLYSELLTQKEGV